ncbi:MAG: IclR family transcriptional regulator [Dysosmobacter sp.]|jgi:transcriptional regulator, iclR family|uniref:IclR family transcriptional regulator n=1 Tax=Dysosmobacter sp. TaxID=2591382 RepID=UPI00307E40DE
MKTSANEAAPKNLDRALDLLNLLATNSNPMNVMEISKALDVTRTTAYAMLGSLSKKKLVEKDAETGRYSIGYKVLELAECYYHRYPFLYLAEKYIVALAQKWSLKVNVSVLKEPAISLLLASKDPSFLVPRMVIGHIMPAYATASGKVLLSALSEEKLEEVLDSIQLVSYTAKTIVDREELKECLREARKNGFATEVDELMVLRSCVAAPIQDRSGAYIGAISFSGSTETIAANMPALTNDIISTGKQISTELGYNYITI